MFKVGGWVISEKGISNITDIKLNGKNCESKVFFSNGICMFEFDVELWQPKEGEWCWFYDDTESTPIFGKFYKKDKTFNCYYPQHQINAPYSFCDPFIGELPSFLKE